MFNIYRHWGKLSSVKKILTIALISVIIFSICFSAFAHSGRTDSNGGHYNRSTGQYHYHSGEYAGRGSSSGLPWYLIMFLILQAFFLFAVFIYTLWSCIMDSSPKTIISKLKQALCNYDKAKQHTILCDNELKEIKGRTIIPNRQVAEQIKKCETAKKEEEKALNIIENYYNDCNTKMAKFLLFFSPSKKQKLEELKRECKKLL